MANAAKILAVSCPARFLLLAQTAPKRLLNLAMLPANKAIIRKPSGNIRRRLKINQTFLNPTITVGISILI